MYKGDFFQVISLNNQVDQFKAQNLHFMPEILDGERIKLQPVTNANFEFKLASVPETIFYKVIDQKFAVQISGIVNKVATVNFKITFGNNDILLNELSDLSKNSIFNLLDLYMKWTGFVGQGQTKYISGRGGALPQNVINGFCTKDKTSFTVDQISFEIPNRDMIIELFCLSRAGPLK
jgi:hypothetical protein